MYITDRECSGWNGTKDKSLLINGNVHYFYQCWCEIRDRYIQKILDYSDDEDVHVIKCEGEVNESRE